ncbi:MAG: serine/threonine-protein kinase [Verrucomicrobiota bacterium]
MKSDSDLVGQHAAKLMETVANQPAATTGTWQPPAAADLAPLLPGFEIVELLGRGGMGAVYKAIQKDLEREVAIKLLPPELGENPEFEARFRREAKSMAQLNHPNIVQVHDFGQTTAGHHYFVMEFIDGADLRDLIRNSRIDSVQALKVVSQICEALEFAHTKGYVHRDIKPANILVSRDGRVKVGDFGLAKLVDLERAKSATEQMDLTMTGVAIGTPDYIAPEQMSEDGEVDHRADIYSLGIMFYEMLTGSLPRGAVKAPSDKLQALDVRIDGVVFKAMEPDPSDRYQTATHLRSDLDTIRTGPTPAAAEPRKKRVDPRIVIAIIAGCGIVYFFALMLFERLAHPPQSGPPPAGSEANSLVSPSAAWKEDGILVQKLKHIVIPEIEFVATSLVDVNEFLRTKSIELDFIEQDPAAKGINFVSAPSAQTSRSVTIKMSNATLGDAIHYTCLLANVGVRIDNNALVFHSLDQQPIEIPASESDGVIEQKLKEILIPEISFVQTPYSEVIYYLNTRSIELDAIETDPTRKGVNIILGPGSWRETNVTLNLTNTTLGEALQYVAEFSDATVRVDGNAVILIGESNHGH